jgi:hypothetical protein
MRIGKFEA